MFCNLSKLKKGLTEIINRYVKHNLKILLGYFLKI